MPKNSSKPCTVGRIFVAVAEVVLAELAGGVAQRLEQLGDGRVFLLQADRGARHADLGEAGADRVLAGDEAGAPGGAALLRVVVGEGRALLRDAVDVGRAVAHHAAAEVADVPDADVVAPEDEDVRLFRFCHGGCLSLIAIFRFSIAPSTRVPWPQGPQGKMVRNCSTSGSL